MNIDEHHRKQIEMLTEFLHSDLAQSLLDAAEERRVVYKLKNENVFPAMTIIDEMVEQTTFLESKILGLEQDIFKQNETIKIILEALSTSIKNAYEADVELTSLKSRYGIF